MNKKYLIVGLLVLFLSMPVYATISLTNFDISINVSEPENATVIENWKVVYETSEELSDLKADILESSLNLEELENINPEIKPHVYVDKKNLNGFTISFDEENAKIRLEYTIQDVSLIKYLDYQDQIIWKFNEILFSQFIISGVFNIPKGSQISITLYDPLIIGDVVPTADMTGRTILWTGLSSNEIRILAIEKKPPKPTFVISNLFSKDYLNKSYFNILFILLVIVLILLIFRNKVSYGIKKFITKHSVIKPRKQINEIIDFDFVNKKNK